MKISSIVFIIIALTQCTSQPKIVVKDVIIKIEPYKEGSGGKFWNICFEPYNWGDSYSVVYFKIYAKNKRVSEYFIECIHLRDSCNLENIYNHFGDRWTSSEERNWFGSLDAKDIDSIQIRVKRNETDNRYIFNKVLYSQELK